MKVKTADLTDIALDWVVTVADGLRPTMRHDYMRAKAVANNYKGDLAWHLEVTPNEPITVDEAGVTHMLRAYSEQWYQGGPIIEREGINLSVDYQDDWLTTDMVQIGWKANLWNNSVPGTAGFLQWAYGPTPLVAAMRCFVASRFGDEVDIPEELL